MIWNTHNSGKNDKGFNDEDGCSAPNAGSIEKGKMESCGKTASKVCRTVLLALILLLCILLIILVCAFYSAISRRLKTTNVQVNVTNGSCKTCPPGWKLIRSTCYYFSSTTETWERSKELCAERNGILLIIRNESEMTSLLPTINRERYWIGLTRDSKDSNRWIWIDGSPLTYSAWDKGEPNNDYNNESCAEIMGGFQAWNDRPCKSKLYYICKGISSC